MFRSEAQRTLIKSPLELWEELSDPASLARHLGEFGEIRITRTDQQKTVEWEADSLNGTIELFTSGWGTRVTLTVADAQPQELAGEAPRSDPAAAEPPRDAAVAAPQSDPPATHPPHDPAVVPPQSDPPATHPPHDPAVAAPQSDPPATHPPHDPAVAAPQSDPPATESPDPAGKVISAGMAAHEEQEGRPRRGLFARLLRRRDRGRATGEPRETSPAAAEAAEPSTNEPAATTAEPATAAMGATEPMATEERRDNSPAAAGAASAPTGDPAATEERRETPPEVAAESACAPTSAPAAILAGPDPPAGQPRDTWLEEIEAEREAAQRSAADAWRQQQKTDPLTDERAGAILEGVLDRLGAAHHRPFSRAS